MITPVSGVAETTAREIRAELGRQRISQNELARRLRVTQNYLWRRMAGQTPFSLDDVDAIAAELGVSPSDLVKRGEHN